MKDRRAETVTKCLDLIWKHGALSRIFHDLVAEFLSDILQQTAQLMGLEQLPVASPD